MRFISDKITFTPAMKSFAKETLKAKLARTPMEPKSVDVKLNKLNNEKLKVELCVEKFRAQAIDDDFYIAFTKAAAKIKAIIIKNNKKDKRAKVRIQLEATEASVEDIEALKLISKEKVFELKPITTEEAINELDYTDYLFYVFKNVDDNDSVCIIYKRLNDDYGLIKCR